MTKYLNLFFFCLSINVVHSSEVVLKAPNNLELRLQDFSIELSKVYKCSKRSVDISEYKILISAPKHAKDIFRFSEAVLGKRIKISYGTYELGTPFAVNKIETGQFILSVSREKFDSLAKLLSRGLDSKHKVEIEAEKSRPEGEKEEDSGEETRESNVKQGETEQEKQGENKGTRGQAHSKKKPVCAHDLWSRRGDRTPRVSQRTGNYYRRTYDTGKQR